MNKHDSERIAGVLFSLGYEETENPDEAAVIIINTCAVRENAVKRLKGYVRSLGNAKRNGALIGIAGCVAQVEKGKLIEELKVDFVVGPDRIGEIPDILDALAYMRSHEERTGFKDDFFASELPVLRETQHHAWISITKGCDNFCTYCIVPYARGTMVSRPLEQIITEAKKTRDDGANQITLLGQNVNAYGKDIYGKTEFVKLLEKVSEIDFEVISFATSHPADFQDELVDLIKERKNISRQIHLPVQSGSNRILEKMKRRYSRERYIEIAEKIRTIPDVSLTTDIIVGFPGETEADFEETLSLVEELKFDHVFTFIFSPRPGTEAAQYSDQVPHEVKKERFERLVQAVSRAALERNKESIGKVLAGIVEGESKSGGFTQARTLNGKIVLFKDGERKPGEKVMLRIKSAGPYHLDGEII